MKRPSSIHFLIPALILAFAACQDDHDHDDHGAPTITINSPTESLAINTGDTLHIDWVGTDDDDLHEALVVLENATTSSVLFSDTPAVHGLATFTYSANVPVGAVGPASLKLTVTISDHAEHEVSKVVNLTVN